MSLSAVLDGYRPRTVDEQRDVARIRALQAAGEVWSRALPLHVTGSALIVHPPTGRVLLRWHERMGSWLQVGGHADPGELDPVGIAVREAREETGLADVAPWPDPRRPRLLHAVCVPVPAAGDEPAHEHADLRFLLASDRPDEARPESPAARVRWLTLDEARALAAEDNLRETLDRLAAELGL